jgi:hypothetical protein
MHISYQQSKLIEFQYFQISSILTMFEFTTSYQLKIYDNRQRSSERD